MLSGEGNENGEKTTIGLISQKATLHVQHTFFARFFAIVLHDYNVKLSETLCWYSFSSLPHAPRRSILWICSGYTLS